MTSKLQHDPALPGFKATARQHASPMLTLSYMRRMKKLSKQKKEAAENLE